MPCFSSENSGPKHMQNLLHMFLYTACYPSKTFKHWVLLWALVYLHIYILVHIYMYIYIYIYLYIYTCIKHIYIYREREREENPWRKSAQWKGQKLILFADDTNVFCSHSSLLELKNIINLELKNLVEWFRINKLSLNAAKSCYIIFSA